MHVYTISYTKCVNCVHVLCEQNTKIYAWCVQSLIATPSLKWGVVV